MKYKFDCGCEFEVHDETIKECDGLPSISIDYYNIPDDCPATWSLIQTGRTKGIFQLESNLGRKWAKQLAPSNLGEMSALISLIRPGCLRAIVDEKSMTEHYCDRKSAKEEVTYFHKALRPILEETYGVLCIHEDTFISMADGRELPIKQLVPNDIVNSVIQTDFTIVSDICTDIIKSPKTTGIELLLENGYRIKLTNDHKVLTQRGAVEVQNLTDEDVVQIVVKQNSNKNNSIYPIYNTDTKISYLIGQLVGDGCSGTVICSGTKSNHDILYNYLQRTFPELNFAEYFQCRSWYISINGKKLLNKQGYGNRKTEYRYFVEQLGLHKTKNDKHIPIEIFQTSNENRRAFLAGLFDSDGYSGVHKKGHAICSFCSNNPQIINGVRKLLSLDGIETYIDNDYTHIYINNIKLFNELIGPFLLLKKPTGLMTTAVHYGSFPWKKFKQKVCDSDISYRNYSKKYNISGSSIIKKKLFVNILTAKKAGFKFGDISMMRVKKISPIENQVFYSISIKNTHNLIGNGIVINNCYQEQSMKIAQAIAMFNLQAADVLRKAIGKKKAAIMTKVKKQFIEGCKKASIVTEEQAIEIFGWIQESQRYSFNKCLNPNTLVQTINNKFKTLDEISIGEYIKAPKNQKEDEFVEVIDKIDQGKQMLYEVILESGLTIECTLNHKFLCEDNKIRKLSEIIDNDHQIGV